MAAPLSTQYAWIRESVGIYAPEDRVVHVTGDDARTWLSGQITNDVRNVSAERAVYSLAVNVKGRVLTDLWVRDVPNADPPAFDIVVPERLWPEAQASFDKHIIMEDVELVLDEGLRVLSVQGPRASELLSRGDLRASAYEAARLGDLPGFDLWIDAQTYDETRRRLVELAQELGGGELDSEGWAYAHVLLSIPRCGVDFGADTYPQEAGLKERAVSFNKGCYLGQEVICMLENRGQVSRRLVQLTAEGEPGLAAGAPLLDQDGKRVGELTSVAVTHAPEVATYALGYVKRPFAELGRTLRAGDNVSCTVRAVVGLTTPSGASG